jgi:hypothetical protein
MITLLGFAVSFAVLATFLMRTMLPLRIVAVASNALFIGMAIARLSCRFCVFISRCCLSTSGGCGKCASNPSETYSPGWPIQWGMSEDADR